MRVEFMKVSAFDVAGSLGGGWSLKTIFVPDFSKPLALAIVIAEHMDGVTLAQPAVHLGEKFQALGFRDGWFRGSLGKGAKCFEALEEGGNDSGEFRLFDGCRWAVLRKE